MGNAFEYVLRIGDACLVHGQRLAEWCGHAPVIEEDIALANIALDHIGQARSLLTLGSILLPLFVICILGTLLAALETDPSGGRAMWRWARMAACM